MKYLLIILCVMLGVLLALTILALVLYNLLVKSVGKENLKEILAEAKKYKEREREAYSRPKNLSNMTKLIEPRIQEAFPSFNKEQLFRTTENDLNQILEALEKKKPLLIKNKSLSFVRPKVEAQIDALNDKNKTVEFRDIRYNKHAIKEYRNESGAAVLSVVTSLSYYYDSNDDKEEKFKDLRKETRYETKYIYVYDEDKVSDNVKLLGINCPNCGAPIDFFGRGKCSYCGSGVEPINLKNWKVIDYEEY